MLTTKICGPSVSAGKLEKRGTRLSLCTNASRAASLQAGQRVSRQPLKNCGRCGWRRCKHLHSPGSSDMPLLSPAGVAQQRQRYLASNHPIPPSDGTLKARSAFGSGGRS